jgi:hypothetical protein
MPSSQLREPDISDPDRPEPQNVEAPRRDPLFESWYRAVGSHGDTALRSVADSWGLAEAEWPSGNVVTRLERPVATFPVEPPHDLDALRDYLVTRGQVDDPDDPVQLLDAVEELLCSWSLSAEQHSAILALFSGMPGVSVVGVASDRLGRLGRAFAATSPTPGSFEARLVASDDGSSILSIETVYTGGIAELDVPAPAVMRSTSWY